MQYSGGKGKTYQHIINLIPPHTTYIEAFLGGGAVMRHKRPALKNIGIEIDIIAHNALNTDVNFESICGNAFDYLKNYSFTGDEVVYCDPPYYPTTRSRDRVYRYDFNDEDHRKLLTLLKSLPCKILLSGYDNDLYHQELSEWSKYEFTAKAHNGIRKESIWYNYPQPTKLHDPRYMGENFRERQNIKRRIDRLKQKIGNLSLPEQSAIRDWLLSVTN